MAVVAPLPPGELGTLQLFRREPSCLQLGGRGRVTFLTLWTDKAHQPLGHDGDDGRCDEEWGHADIAQACNCRRRIVRMKCTENQVSSQRGLHSDLGRLLV